MARLDEAAARKKVKCITNIVEKYVCFTTGQLRFIDSFQFMTKSLETLANTLESDDFWHFKRHIPEQ